MAWVFDPETGEYYDDGEVGASFLTGGSQNPYMPDASFSGFNLPADYNKYGMEPYEMADVNQQLTGTKSLLAILANPMFNYMTSQAVPGADTFDYESVAGMPSYGQPGIMGGGGGYGGGGGGYGGAVAPPPTPWLTSADSDPVLSGIKKAVLQGQNPTQIMSGLLSNTDETNQDVLDGYQSAAYEMFKEKNATDQAAQQGPGMPEQTAAQQWMAKTGLPDPNQLYGAGGGPLPEEFEQGFQGATQADAARLAAMERNLGPMEKRVKDLSKGAWTEDLFGPSAVQGALARDTFGGGDFGGGGGAGTRPAVAGVRPGPTPQESAIARAAREAQHGTAPRIEGPTGSSQLDRMLEANPDYHGQMTRMLDRGTGVTATTGPRIDEDTARAGAISRSIGQILRDASGFGAQSAVAAPQIPETYGQAFVHDFGDEDTIGPNNRYMVNPSSGVSMAPQQQTEAQPGRGGITAAFRGPSGVGTGGTGLFGDRAPNTGYNASKAKQGSRAFAQRSADAQRRLIKETTARNADADVGGRELLGRFLASQGRSPAKDRMNSQMAMLRMMGIGV